MDKQVPSLSEVKKERLQLERDKQLLANRIKLLQQEEEKAWKNIQNIRQKTNNIINSKKTNEQKHSQKFHNKFSKERALSEQRQKYNDLKKQRWLARGQVLQSVFKKKRQLASEVRSQKRVNNFEKQELQHELSLYNKGKTRMVQTDRQNGLKKVHNFQLNKIQEVNETFRKKQLEEEHKSMYETQRKLLEMETLELELIDKLQNTQRVHQKVSTDLRNSVGSSKSNFDSFL